MAKNLSLELEVPSEIMAGNRLEGRLVGRLRKPVSPRTIEVRLRGVARTNQVLQHEVYGQEVRSVDVTVIDLAVPFAFDTPLRPDRFELPFAIDLPENLPPSNRDRVRYLLEASADVPFAVD